MARTLFVRSNQSLFFQAEKSENEDDVVFGEIQSIDTPQSAKSRKSARSTRSTTSTSARSVKSSRPVASAHADAVTDNGQIEIVQLNDGNTGDEIFKGNDGDGVVENSDILIINHDDDNADNNSSDEIEAGSGSVDYDDSFLRNKSASSVNSVEKRNDSANHSTSEPVAEENEEVIGALNNETNDAMEVEQGVEAMESIVDLDQAPLNPYEEETFNIEDTNPPSLPGSAVSRISARSAEKAAPASSTTSPRSDRESAEENNPPQSARSQLQSAQSHRSSRSASARSQTGSSTNQPISTSQAPLQGSATSQVSRHTMNEPVVSATSRKSTNSAKSGKLSGRSLQGSGRSYKSETEGSAKSQSTVITNENATETGNAEEGGDEIGNDDGNVDGHEIEDAGEILTSDEMSAEADAETENNNNVEEDENIEPENGSENAIEASADDIETTKEVTLFSSASFSCVANFNMPTP